VHLVAMKSVSSKSGYLAPGDKPIT
jgi:hypothetical protein